MNFTLIQAYKIIFTQFLQILKNFNQPLVVFVSSFVDVNFQFSKENGHVNLGFGQKVSKV